MENCGSRKNALGEDDTAGKAVEKSNGRETGRAALLISNTVRNVRQLILCK